ncbi:ABC transporter permease [Arthrobacter sp. H5]|uniref:ABC transporter permease n=1 Tax=Arthrobacter sp. H5 TaxID=1267973 RepID=UPI0004B7E211|nr:ABC transporter permease [Arthrobacter sp. H5]
MRERYATLNVIRHAAYIAAADFRTVYTPLTWGVGWLGRVIMQVLFFAVIGLLLQDPDAVLYLFVGQAIMMTATETLLSIQSTQWERGTGTLGLLTAAPARLWPVFLGRSLQWMPSGVATASIVLFAIGPFLEVAWSLPAAAAVVVCLICCALGTYGLALFVAALVLRLPEWRNVVANIVQMAHTLFCGVVVPVAFWPTGVQGAAQALPLTHGLAAVRLIEDRQEVPVEVWGLLSLCIALGAGWLMLAVWAFERFGEHGRRTGTIDFD